MIPIDYQGGSHGSYLEFVCNKMARLTVGKPFNSLGASHNRQYIGKRMFVANHYAFSRETLLYDKIIVVRIDEDDLLPLQQISLLRAGDYMYDNDQLEIDTYNKLNNNDYRWILDKIVENFFTNQIQNSYDAVKDPSWPNVTNLAEFENLPSLIKKECIEQHKLELLEISSERPDCPRSVLREFFQIGFQHYEQNGFMIIQNQTKYDMVKDIYQFPFKCFYDNHTFIQQIKKVAEWAEMQYNQWEDIQQLHDEFLQRQPYTQSKSKCDAIVNRIKNNNVVQMPKVDLLEEAYINAKLGWNYFI